MSQSRNTQSFTKNPLESVKTLWRLPRVSIPFPWIPYTAILYAIPSGHQIGEEVVDQEEIFIPAGRDNLNPDDCSSSDEPEPQSGDFLAQTL
jgi:hypothetical protein